MKTRSQTIIETNNKNIIYEVVIDFDNASKAWRSNKKSIGNCQYKYICQYEKQVGNLCKKVCYKTSEYCWSHRNKK